MTDESPLLKQKREKMLALRELGANPYANGFEADATAAEIAAEYGEAAAEALQAALADGTARTRRVAGRVVAFRSFGKSAFLHLQDRSGRVQVFVARDKVGEDFYKTVFKLVEAGDFLGVAGPVFRTKTGELTIEAREVRVLTKALQPLPEKWHGLTDVEKRYRMRYVDLIVNPEVRETFRKRSRIVQEMRRYFVERDYLEVETPMMQPIAGGAAARPFVTHHNALDMPLYLRIAPELYLKRLVVGGLERVFEINRNFRNEGVSTQHNPEFTMLEFYRAYATYHDLMAMTEELFERLAREVRGGTKVPYQGREIEFKGPWARLPMAEAVVRHGGLRESEVDDPDRLRARAREIGLREFDDDAPPGVILTEIFEETCEKELVQPTFVIDYPTVVSPLSRANDARPEIVDRFELFIVGREIANGFSELTDPVDQRARFEEQIRQKAEGASLDEDFLRALEYGMPPTAGEGIGVDRLAMLLTDSASIRDVILFPLLRPEA